MGVQELSGSLPLPTLAIIPCRRDKTLPLSCDASCPDRFAQTVLCLIRFVGAAYTTGTSDCWEAAHRLCDDAIDVVDGPLLVARVAALVRLLRGNCPRELVYMPPSCNRLSVDEKQLICLLEAPHGAASGQRMAALSGLADPSREAIILQAVNALMALSPIQTSQ